MSWGQYCVGSLPFCTVVTRSEQEGVCGFLAVRRSLDSTRRCLSILEVGSDCIITPSRRCCPHGGIGISSLSQLGNASIVSRQLRVASFDGIFPNSQRSEEHTS